MKTVTALLLMAMLTGCYMYPKHYNLRESYVIEASPKAVKTIWIRGAYYWNSDTLLYGDRVKNVCPETVPPAPSQFKSATVDWDSKRKCWLWKSK